VILEVTPRVTYDGEIILDLVVENSTLGSPIEVGGQAAPTFGSRKVTTRLRLREGESNLLAGLLRESDRRSLRGIPGLLRLPVFRQFLSDNDQAVEQTDIVMLLTPHIVRTHELTADDLAPIYIGTQQNLGLGGPPPIIAVPPVDAPPAVGAAPPDTITPPTPGVAPGGVPGPPIAAPPGAQPIGPPGTVPAPTPVTPLPEPGTPAPAPGAAPQPRATPAQVIVTVPGATFQVAGGPYTVPVSVNNAQRISVMTLTVTFNPAVVRVRNVQDGTFMRQGGVPTSFTPRIDNVGGRVDIAITRTGDQVGATGAGLLAALLFDAVGPGSAVIQTSGVATTPDGAPVELQFSPDTVAVR
jgi:general secretion pathway protein D